MLEIALSREEPWPDRDWEAIASLAADAAISRTPYSELVTATTNVEISIRLTSNEELHTLNRQYRGTDMPTNVLSFAMVSPDLIATIDRNLDNRGVLLGDIVLAHDVCAADAAARRISIADHATHLIVHGALHLLGYDHVTDDGAEAMESIERAALADLNIADPYMARED